MAEEMDARRDRRGRGHRRDARGSPPAARRRDLPRASIFFDLGNFIFQVPPPDTLLDEPILWESVVAYVEFQGRDLKSIKFRAIAQNKIGEGQPDIDA